MPMSPVHFKVHARCPECATVCDVHATLTSIAPVEWTVVHAECPWCDYVLAPRDLHDADGIRAHELAALGKAVSHAA
jgi:hypothetical protein